MAAPPAALQIPSLCPLSIPQDIPLHLGASSRMRAFLRGQTRTRMRTWSRERFPSTFPKGGLPPLRCLPGPAGKSHWTAVERQSRSHTCVLSGGSCVSVLEELDGRVATDAILLGQIRLLRGIYLCQSDLGAFGLQFPSCFGIFRGQSFAVATPGGI